MFEASSGAKEDGKDAVDVSQASFRTLYRITHGASELEKTKKKIKEESRRKRKKDEESNYLPSAFQIHQRLSMGPIQKWRKRRKIPWKLLLHIVLVTLVTVLLFLYTHKRQRFFRTQGGAFAQLFLPENYMTIEESGYENYIAYITESDSVVMDINQTVNTYYSLSMKNVDTIVYLPKSRQEPNIIRPIKVQVGFWGDNPRDILTGRVGNGSLDLKAYTFEDELDKEHYFGYELDEFIRNDTRFFLDRLEQMNMKIQFQSLDFSTVGPWHVAECIQWTIQKSYVFKGSGSLAAILTYEYDKCENIQSAYKSQFYKATTCISLVLMIISFISQFLTFKSVVKRCRIFWQIRNLQKNQKQKSGGFLLRGKSATSAALKLGLPTEEVRVIDFPKFISLWFLVQWFADVFNIIGFFLLLLDHIDTVFPPLFLGLGAFFTWISTLRFFQYAPSFYALIVTIRNGAPNALRFIVCVLPFFLGFAVSGTTIFGHYNKNFDDVEESAISLFCMTNGDAIHGIFDGLFGINKFIGYFSRIYVYVFCILFICAILNIFIIIMQDAFERSRQQFAEKAEAEMMLQSNQSKSFSDDDSDEEDTSSESSLELEDNIALFDQESNQKGHAVILDSNATEIHEGTQTVQTRETGDKLQKFVDQQAILHNLEQKDLHTIVDEESISDNINRILFAVEDLFKERKSSKTPSTEEDEEDGEEEEEKDRQDEDEEQEEQEEEQEDEEELLLKSLQETCNSLKATVYSFKGKMIGRHLIDESYYSQNARKSLNRLSQRMSFYQIKNLQQQLNNNNNNSS